MMKYIYDENLNLIGSGSKEQLEGGILEEYYIDCGYIISIEKFNFGGTEDEKKN